ncbi:unnamed protein product [Blepharisma stoltei]|uniref:Uncharacterized protein n=1 Tax=Blepharisma stoltei TaxID=1481888 RepID=A0AAU9IUI2_9CILI|nr:unnamed protein product [Blepharisma stoltei]
MEKQVEGYYIPVKAYNFVVPDDAFENDEDRPNAQALVSKLPTKQANKAKHSSMAAPGAKIKIQMPKNLLISNTKEKDSEATDSKTDFDRNSEKKPQKIRPNTAKPKWNDKNISTEEDILDENQEEKLMLFEEVEEKPTATMAQAPRKIENPQSKALYQPKTLQRPLSAVTKAKVPEIFKEGKAITKTEKAQKDEIKQKAIKKVSDWMEEADRKREKEVQKIQNLYQFKKSDSKLSENIKELMKRLSKTNDKTSKTIGTVLKTSNFSETNSLYSSTQQLKEDKLVSDEVFSMVDTRFKLNQRNFTERSINNRIDLHALYSNENNSKSSWIPDFLISHESWNPSKEQTEAASDHFIDGADSPADWNNY